MNFLARNVVARFSSQYATVIEDFCKLVYKKVFSGKMTKLNLSQLKSLFQVTYILINDGTTLNGLEIYADGLGKVEKVRTEVAVQRSFKKRCSENMQQIYRRTRMPKWYLTFNVVLMWLWDCYWRHDIYG